MAWKIEMVEILRAMINDFNSTDYTDLTLQRVIASAALQVNREMKFSLPYKVTISITSPDIVPDPTFDGDANSPSTRDDDYVNLVCLKAACMTDRGGAILAAKRAIAVKDGDSYIDLRGTLQGRLKLLETGWCSVFDAAKMEYKLGGLSSGIGVAIMSPFRLVGRGFDYGGGTSGTGGFFQDSAEGGNGGRSGRDFY